VYTRRRKPRRYKWISGLFDTTPSAQAATAQRDVSLFSTADFGGVEEYAIIRRVVGHYVVWPQGTLVADAVVRIGLVRNSIVNGTLQAASLGSGGFEGERWLWRRDFVWANGTTAQTAVTHYPWAHQIDWKGAVKVQEDKSALSMSATASPAYFAQGWLRVLVDLTASD